MTENEFAYRAKILCAKLLMRQHGLTDMDKVYNGLYGIYNSVGDKYVVCFASADFSDALIAVWSNNRLTAGLYKQALVEEYEQ